MGKMWIAGAIKQPRSACTRNSGVPQGQKIPAKKLNAAAKKGGLEGKRANLAKTLKGFEIMPWTTKSFAGKHNKKLSGKAATKAASQATAMVKAGVPEGEAIATANKTGNRMMKKGMWPSRKG